MAKVKRENIKIEKGIFGIRSGSSGNLVIDKNGVIRIKGDK